MKSKVFVTCLAIALAIVLFTGTFAVMGWGSLLRQVGGALLYPFQWLAHEVGEAVAGFRQYTADVKELSGRVEALEAENESLRAQIQDAEILREEYGWLYGYLSMKQEHTDYSLCAAYVTAAVYAGEYAVELTLNKGSTSGLEQGMPVVTTRGLVGMVTEVGLTYCRVRTILDTASSVGAVAVRTGERGLCEGSFDGLRSGQTVLRYLPAEADVSVGDNVLTSGTGSVYPYGIPVGEISGVSANGFNRTTEATVTPYVDFSNLTQVMVLTGYDRYAEGYGPETEAP